MISIRKYTDNDYDDVFQILKDNFEVEKAKNCFDENTLEFVALNDNKIVGYFIMRKVIDIIKVKKIFYLEYVCVDKKMQNKGIGKEIMNYVIKFAKEQKASYIELTSSYTRKAAHHLYEEFDFKIRESNIFRRML